MVVIPMTKKGDLDYEYLQKKLRQYKTYNSIKVCTVSAGSNLTGTLFDVDRIAVMAHKAGFLAFFDYAAVGPYQDINMNGLTQHGIPQFAHIPQQDQVLAYKDAVFLSPHKLVGGPGSSGVLIAKRHMLASLKPYRTGGGIVIFVDKKEHQFINDIEEREESGTPGILQDIKAAMVF